MITHLQITTAVALAAGYFAAHAAGLLTKAHAPRWVLGAVTVALSTLAGIIPTVVWRPNDDWKVYLANVFAALLTATLAHRSQIPEAIQASTPNTGVGSHHHRQAGHGDVVTILLVVLIVVVILVIAGPLR